MARRTTSNNIMKSATGITIRYELIGIILAVLIQTCTGIWWAAGVTASVASLKIELQNLRAELKDATQDPYYGRDAIRDFASRDARLEVLSNRLTETLDRTARMSERVSVLESNKKK